jgi:hypothetical protein
MKLLFRRYFLASLVILYSGIGFRAAASESLTDFAARVTAAISNSQFQPQKFCTVYSNPSFMTACSRGVPWKVLNPKSAILGKIISVSSSTGFISLSFLRGGHATPITFSALNFDSSGWKLDLDNKTVWDQFSVSWQKVTYAYGEMRFAQIPDPATVAELISIAESDQVFLSEQLRSPVLKSLNIYFLNDPTISAQLSEPWNAAALSGGARRGFMLFLGDIKTRLNSQVLHELVHEYTVYNSDWTGNKKFFPNSMLAEGLAVWFQIPFITQDLGRMEDATRSYFIKVEKSDLQNALRFLKTEPVFSLLDNNIFRELDSEGYHPAYYVAAAMIDYLVNRVGVAGVKDLWPKMTVADASGLTRILSKFGTDEQFKVYVETYISAHLESL